MKFDTDILEIFENNYYEKLSVLKQLQVKQQTIVQDLISLTGTGTENSKMVVVNQKLTELKLLQEQTSIVDGIVHELWTQVVNYRTSLHFQNLATSSQCSHFN